MKVRKGYKEILAALAEVSSERAIFDVLLRRLFNKLDVVLSSIPQSYLRSNDSNFDNHVSTRHHRNNLSRPTEKVVEI